MSLLSYFTGTRKDMTFSDVHISVDGKPKKKKPLDGQPDDDNLPVTNKWMPGVTLHCDEISAPTTAKYAEVIKVDESLGLVLGWAIVCKVDGEDYYDLQDDHIPESSMLSALVDFMQNSRVAKEMHSGDEIGPVVFAFPLTTDIAKAFDIETKKTGAMIAMKPNSAEMLAKFNPGADGSPPLMTGFSIGGVRLSDEEVL